MAAESMRMPWGATITEEPFLGSLRGKDPKRTATVTMHVSKNFQQEGRSPGIKSFHFGPGQKVMGGELRYAYEDRSSGKIKLEKSLDPAEILAQQRAGISPRPGSTGSARHPPHQAPAQGQQSYTSLAIGTPGPDFTEQRRARQQQQAEEDGSGSPPGGHGQATALHGRRSVHAHGGHGLETTKLVFFDGKEHHVIDAPADGTVRPGAEPVGWQPPHLEHRDIEPGKLLGVVECPGSQDTKLIGSHHRRMPDNIPSGSVAEGAGTLPGMQPGAINPLSAYRGTNEFSSFGTMARGTARYGLGQTVDRDSLEIYARSKAMGYKEYEATCKSMEGMGCWEKAQLSLTSSMRHGQPSHLMTPFEHTTTRLSMRR